MEWTQQLRQLPVDYWDRAVERYSGETVLDDYMRLADGRADERVVLIRFLAVQYFTNVLRGDWDPGLLRLERSAALNALGTGLLLDRELRMLRQALQQVPETGPWPAPSVALVLAAAGMAQERGHASGALALYRIAAEAALETELWAFASAAAQGVAGLAREHGDARGHRRWQRRARALERRARVA